MASQFRALGGDAARLIAGHALLTGGQWLSLLVISRMAGGVALGRYALALAIAAPVFLMANLGLRTVIATDVGPTGAPIGRYLRLRILTSLLACLILLLLGFIALDVPQCRMLVAVVLLKLADSISDIFYGNFQRDGRMSRIAVSSALRGTSLVFTLSVALYLGRTATEAVLLGAASWLLIAVTLDSSPSHTGARASSTLSASALAAVAFPLGLVASLDSLNSNLAKYYLEGFWGTHLVGQYAAALSIVLMGGVLLSGLGHAALPRIAHLNASRQHHSIARLARGLTALAGLGGLTLTGVAAFFGDPLLIQLFGPPLEGTGALLAWLFAAGTIWYCVTVWGFVLNGVRAFRPQVPLFILTVLTSVVSGAVLIPAFGSRGAALSFGLSMSVRAVGSLLIWRGVLREAEF